MRDKSAPKKGVLPSVAPPPYARRGGAYAQVDDADNVLSHLARTLGEQPAPRPRRSPNPPKKPSR